MVTLLLVRSTLDGCQATNTITDTGIPTSRESDGLIYLFILIVTLCLVVCLFFIIVFSVAFFTFYITFMSFAFSYPVIFCAYRLSTNTGVPSLVSNFPKTYARTCFELTLTCLVLARLIFSRKKRCILWPFKLTSDLFLLVNNIRNWRILRLYLS